MLVASIPSRWRAALAATLLVGLVAAVLILSGIVQPPSAPFATERVEEETPEWTLSSDQEDGIDGCDCVWRIGCPKFRWQVNFTSPRYRCGYEEMSSSLTQECLAERHRKRGRQLQLRIVGDTREAFITDYIRDRLSLPAARETCRLTRAPPSAKLFDSPEEVHCTVTPLDGADTCEMVYETPEIRLEYHFLHLLGDDVFRYVDNLRKLCEADGCRDDIFIISGGTGELLNSTLMDSFAGLRRFQNHYKRLLPLLKDLATKHKLEVVWKIHEPVTDELIADKSMVRNDLLQEYNALIMEQTMRSSVRVWTSHMIMKLHHIEECATFTDDAQVNSDPWRCEDVWVAGDKAHSEYFDTIFNKICDKLIRMPENPCCSA